MFIVELYGGHGAGQVRDDPLQQSVVHGEADEHLELVILAEPAAGRLDLGDQLGVHPPQLRRPRHRRAAPLGRAGGAVGRAPAPAARCPRQLRLVEIVDNL